MVPGIICNDLQKVLCEVLGTKLSFISQVDLIKEHHSDRRRAAVTELDSQIPQYLTWVGQRPRMPAFVKGFD